MKHIYMLILCTGLMPVLVSAQNLVWVKKSAPVARETYAVAFSHDGKKVFSGSECGPTYLRIFNTYTGEQLWQNQVDSPLMCAQGVKFNSNGSKVVTLEELGNLLIYDYSVDPPVKLQEVSLGQSYSFGLAFNPAGDKIATACSGGKLLIHNANTGTEIHSIDAHLNWVTNVDWSVDELIATCGDDLKVKLWDSAGNFIREMNGHTSPVSCVKFTPDGNHIVSGGKDNTIKVWETSTGNLVSTLTGHTSEVKQVDVSDDGQKIVSGSFDKSIRVWDFSSGNELHNFKTNDGGRVFSVDYAPGTDRYIVAGTSSGDVQVWDMMFPTTIDNLTTGIDVQLYPNPADDILHITSGSVLSSLAVYDVSGKVIKQVHDINKNQASIDIAHLAAGNYYVLVNTVNSSNTAIFTKRDK